MKKKKLPASVITNEVAAEQKLMLANGLSDALFGPQTLAGIQGSQLSQTDTLFKNLRWYLVSNMRQLLSQLYVEVGLIQTIVDLPVDDAFRGGITVKTEQLNEEQKKELHTTMEREDDIGETMQGLKNKRLYGGGGVLIITDQDPETPLVVQSVKKGDALEFRAVDMWELYGDQMTNDDGEKNLKPIRIDDKAFNYYSKRVNATRVIKMKGRKAPSFVRPRLRGWGLSECEVLVRSVNQYLKSTDLSFEVLDEHKLDIFKIKGLAAALIQKDGAAKIHQRVQLANQQKNYQNALTMDAEDDYVQKELSFAGIAEIMDQIRKQVASDLRMPLTKLFGISAAGFSSGEDDIENYNSMIESTIRGPAKFDMIRVVEIRCQQLFGMVPDDLEIEFQPLRVLSSEQEETVKDSKFARIAEARRMGEMDSKEFKEACNKENLLGVTLDVSRETLPPMAGEDGEGGGAPVGKQSATVAPESPVAKNSLKNSDEYEVAAFKESGGAEMYDPWRKRLATVSKKSDKALWAKAEALSEKTFGKNVWQFTVWYYSRHGGQFE